MEHDTGDVTSVTLERVHLPVFVARQAPELDSLVIGSRCKHLHGWVERDPVHALFVAVKNMLYLDLSATNNFLRSATLLLHRELF